MRFNRLWIAVLLAVSASAQQPYGEKVDVTVVEVPVTVADRSGTAVRGLTKADFEVFDSGKKVAIDYFEVIDLASPEIHQSDAKLPAAAYRNFLLLFDLANSAPTSIGRAQSAALEFVQKQMADRDVAAVAGYTAKDGIHLLTNFTRDRALLAQAIASLGASADFKVPDALKLTSIPDPTSTQPGVRSERFEEEYQKQEAMNRLTEANFEKEQIRRIQDQLASFGSVALALDRLHGQKQVILLSEGFPAHLLTGREKLGFQATRQENAAVQSGELWKVDTEKRFGSVSGIQEITAMAQLFQRSDVRLHAIDIRGLRTDSDASAAAAGITEGLRALTNEGLSLVARPTGGQVFKNSNDLGERFRNLLKSQEVIYLIGIRSAARGFGAFHELKVKTRAPNAQVTHRAGYFEATPAANSLERTLGVAEILVKDIPVDDLRLTLAASAVPSKNGIARVPVVVEIGGASVLERLDGELGTVDVFVYAFDEKRQARDFMQQRIELDLAKTTEMLRGSGIRFFGALRLPPGDYSIRVLARVDETSRIGSAHTALSIPASQSGAVLQPLVLDESKDWITILSTDRGQEATDLVSASDQPLVPKASVALDAAAEQRIVLMLYRIPVENLAITPSIVARDGSTHAANLALLGRTAADEDDVAKLVFNFKPAGLQKGSYDLRMIVKPANAAPTVVSIPFAVQ